MQINILATGQAPDYYTFSGDKVTAHVGSTSADFDFTDMPEGAMFQGADAVNTVPAIRDAKRVNGELLLTLCQQVGPGHWQESGWMNAANYDPDAVHVRLDTSRDHAGKAWAQTRQGRVES